MIAADACTSGSRLRSYPAEISSGNVSSDVASALLEERGERNGHRRDWGQPGNERRDRVDDDARGTVRER